MNFIQHQRHLSIFLALPAFLCLVVFSCLLALQQNQAKPVEKNSTKAINHKAKKIEPDKLSQTESPPALNIKKDSLSIIESLARSSGASISSIRNSSSNTSLDGYVITINSQATYPAQKKFMHSLIQADQNLTLLKMTASRLAQNSKDMSFELAFLSAHTF